MKQQMKLSPQQLMVLRLLAVPAAGMKQYLDEELQKNPLMDVDTSAGNDDYESIEEGGGEAANAADGMDDSLADYEDDGAGAMEPRDPNQRFLEPVIPLDLSLNEHLYDQLCMQDTDEKQRIIGKVLIGNISDNGYLSRELSQVSDDLLFKHHVEATEEEIEAVLRMIQRFDPVGIGARNLQECLAIQLKTRDQSARGVKDAERIVERHFNEFVQHRYDKLKERMGLDDERLADAVKAIMSLNPKPSSAYGGMGEGNHYILPDFILDREEDELVLSLSEEHQPVLRIAEGYEEQMQTLERRKNRSGGEEEALNYMRENAQRVRQLDEVIEQRNATMMKVMRCIVKRQKHYLLTGDPADMKGLRLQDVADETGLDVSTVSRVVTKKYVETPFGTLLLKELFSSSHTKTDGEAVASKAVMSIIRETIDGEDKSRPLTDEQLTALLEAKGYKMARRTVAKYREGMGIPVGRLRRGLKSLLWPVALAAVWLLQTLLCFGGGVCAQTPMSYYDSLVMEQQRRSSHSRPQQHVQPESRNAKADKAKKGAAAEGAATHTQKKAGPKPVQAPAAKPATAAVDSSLMRGDDMIDRVYNESIMPSALWYGSSFSDCRVRLHNIPLDSMPDEINIRLVKAETEFCFPVKNCITSPYGWRWNRPHRGVDIALNTGDPVRCCFPGVVRIAKPMGAYGNLVVVRHYNGLETVYGHLSKIKVRPRQSVAAGDVLGLGGSTGRSTGPHLHFEERFQYETFDPEWILDFSNYTLRTRWLHLDKSYFGVTAPRGHRQLAYKADKSYIAETPRHRERKPVYYDVKKGDKLDRIASDFRTTEENIYKLNPGLTKLKVGMRIRVR